MKNFIRKYPDKKISPKAKLAFLFLLTVYIFYSLSNYDSIFLPASHDEMTPTIVPAQKLYLFTHSKPSDYKVNDILWARPPGEKHFQLLRVLARDTGKIEIREGHLWVNELKSELHQDAFPLSVTRKYPPLKKGELFLVHDNQNSSLPDSLTQGCFQSTSLEIKGKVFFFFNGGIITEEDHSVHKEE